MRGRRLGEFFASWKRSLPALVTAATIVFGAAVVAQFAVAVAVA
ncbi:hypothetical protein Q8791_16460 [Nocardiopsis sp. CT-R113]|uniref:Uncharacterized protein n=1 Tax=Nocardiopsis codii TaxID=3065942 RepID=A0ABU7KB68_9ACTN|nr:hypothetical protein [Nocardiopsis sp. CT-R113]MEE2038817.1 hypothetical protein [Nocardiopsis sp. CT-R113]